MAKEVKQASILLAVTTMVGIIFFGTFALAANHDAISDPVIITLVALAGIIWVELVALHFSLVAHPWSIVTSSLLSVVTVLIAGNFKVGALGGAVLMLVLLSIARVALVRDRDRFLKYNPRLMFMPGLKALLLAVIVSLAGLALPIITQSVQREGIVVEEESVSRLLAPLEPVLETLTPGAGVTADTTIDDIIDRQIAEQAATLPPGVTLSEVDRARIRENIAAQLGQEVRGNESFSQIVTTKINDTLTRLTQSNPLTVALVIVILSALALRAAVPFVAFALVGVTALLVKAAQVLGFVVKHEEPATQETLEFT